MESKWAEENLQTIRTLMERSALYRRALAPIMIWAGGIGTLSALLGFFLKIESDQGFVSYWMGVAVFVVLGAFLLVRRQAIKSSEPFWSPPTRRVALALSAPLTVGFVLGLLCLAAWSEKPVADPPTGMTMDAGELFWLPALWALLYGCALHAASFFAASSLRKFGWLLIVAGLSVVAWALATHRPDYPLATWQGSHWLMGSLFGLLQLGYGAYLFMTEKFDL